MAAFRYREHRKILLPGRPESLRYDFGDQAGERKPSGKFFDREKICASRYNTAVVSVSRAFARLEQRGLVWRLYAGHDWMGIDLTPEGFELAETLSANSLVIHQTLSQENRAHDT